MHGSDTWLTFHPHEIPLLTRKPSILDSDNMNSSLFLFLGIVAVLVINFWDNSSSSFCLKSISNNFVLEKKMWGLWTSSLRGIVMKNDRQKVWQRKPKKINRIKKVGNRESHTMASKNSPRHMHQCTIQGRQSLRTFPDRKKFGKEV